MTVGFKFCPSGKIIARFDGLTDLSYNKISLTVIRGTLVQFWKILQNLATFPACVPTRRFPEIIPAHNRKIAFSKKVDEFSRNRSDLLPEKTKFQKKYLDVSRNRQYGMIDWTECGRAQESSRIVPMCTRSTSRYQFRVDHCKLCNMHSNYSLCTDLSLPLSLLLNYNLV